HRYPSARLQLCRRTRIPYTTLFRSRATPVLVFRVGVEDFRQQLRQGGMRQETVGRAGFRILLCHIGERKDVGRIEEIDERMAVADRKSTRLNSSHQINSYDVF